MPVGSSQIWGPLASGMPVLWKCVYSVVSVPVACNMLKISLIEDRDCLIRG